MIGRAAKVAVRALAEAEALADWVRYRVSRDRQRGPFRIVPYRGHGTPDALHLKGRVLAGEAIPPASEEDGAMRNLLHTLRRLESDEVPAARVRARVAGRTWETLADDEGYFQFRLEVDTANPEEEIWRPVQLELVDPVPADGAPVRATGQVLVPPREAAFGIISDIDDTVVKTDVTNLLRMLRLVFLTNARTRLPFEGVSAFYRALHRGARGERTNPVFYVSSSPWNLYDLLTEVFEVHGIPAGPLFLRDYGLAHDTFFSKGHHEHKLGAIEHILSTHPDLPFVLLGDSGQHDPEIYREAVRRFPGRVRAVYIRDVTQAERGAEVQSIISELQGQGVEMLCTADTVAAAEHAAARGLIDPADLGSVRGDKARDEAAPGPIESVVKQ